MAEDKIVHFVGFITNLQLDEFSPMWESYMHRLTSGPETVTLEKAAGKRKSLFEYLSQHECSTGDFRFAFLKAGGNSNFPERKARVVQIGGYLPVQFQPQGKKSKDEVKVLAFLTSGKPHLNYYQNLNLGRLNIYEAYFENCTYNHVLEFFLDESDVSTLIAQLNTKSGIESAVYKECYVVSHAE